MGECDGYNEELEKKLMQAAEYGKMLLEDNDSLKSLMEDVRRDCDRKVEESEQKVHSLQVKVEQMTSQGAWYSEEIGHLKQQLADKQEHIRDTVETGKQLEIGKLNRQVEELRGELEHQARVEAQLQQKISELEGLVQERLNRSEHEPNRSFGLSEEVTLLQEEVSTLQNEVTSLKSELIAKRSELGSLESEVESLRGKVHARDEEMEEIKCQFTTVNNSLEQVRMEKLELKCQLDALQLESNNHANKGNSIFSELDDRRVDAEKKLISLKLSNDSLAEKYNTEREQNKKLKRHITHLLLETSSGRIDSEYVAELERKLAQTMQELKVALEKEQGQSTQVGGVSTVPDPGKTNMTETEYTQFLTTVINGKEQELQRLKKDLSQKSLQLLDQKVKITGQDSRLAQLAAEKAKLQTQSIRLNNKLQELKLKYEPDSVKASTALTVKRTEKIPLDDMEEVKITEISHMNDENTNANQLQFTSQNAGDQSEKSELRQSKPLVETISKVEDNVPKRSALSKCVKSKSVSISDDIEEHEIETVATATKSCTEKQKGRTITAVKHIKAPDQNVNECKNQ